MSVKAPDRLETARLVLRRPQLQDVDAIFSRYASDPEVTRFLSWPRHRSPDETRTFLKFSETEWERWPAGPYLIESRAGGHLLGSTGFSFETEYRAATGYVLAKDAWGQGYATEALRGIVGIARSIGIRRLSAFCNPDHAPSRRVLAKCGFTLEGTLRRHSEFPNLDHSGPCDALCYALLID
jgi:RimJ/RimL family protein N-acetyltransferase